MPVGPMVRAVRSSPVGGQGCGQLTRSTMPDVAGRERRPDGVDKGRRQCILLAPSRILGATNEWVAEAAWTALRCNISVMDALHFKDRPIGRKAAAAAVFVLIGATAGAATAASPGFAEVDARRSDVVLTQAAPARTTSTVWAGQVNPSASERTAVAGPAVTSLPAAADEDRPNAGVMVLAVLGLALWIGARLRRED